MFPCINMFIIALAAGLGLKCALRRARNIFMSKNINFITITIITLEGIEKIKTQSSNQRLVRDNS